MLDWPGVLAQQERYKDLRREAERNCLAIHELALHRRKDRWHRGAMTWLGLALVAAVGVAPGWTNNERKET